MDEFSSPDQIAAQLGVSPKTVREWLRSGELIGIKVGKSWRIHPADLQRLLGEQLYKARAERAARVYSNLTWIRGYCRECGTLMPEPQSAYGQHWVCSQECRGSHDQKAAAVVGYGTEEFADLSSRVVPPY